MVQGFGFRIQGLGFRVQVLDLFRAWRHKPATCLLQSPKRNPCWPHDAPNHEKSLSKECSRNLEWFCGVWGSSCPCFYPQLDPNCRYDARAPGARAPYANIITTTGTRRG